VTSFFHNGDAADPVYLKVRDGTEETYEDGR